MKLSQVKNINSLLERGEDPELTFVSCVNCINGTLTEAGLQPDDWDNVKRLTSNLFLAWSSSNVGEGTVYLGAFV